MFPIYSIYQKLEYTKRKTAKTWNIKLNMYCVSVSIHITRDIVDPMPPHILVCYIKPPLFMNVSNGHSHRHSRPHCSSIQKKTLTCRRWHELNEKILWCPYNGIREFTHSAECPYNGTKFVFSVINFYVVVRAILLTWNKNIGYSKWNS